MDQRSKNVGGLAMFMASPDERRRMEAQWRNIQESKEAAKKSQYSPSTDPYYGNLTARSSQVGQGGVSAGVPEVPFGAEGQYRPAKPLSEAQLAANNRFAYAKNLEMELGISRAQSQLAMQPLFAGVQRSILGKIGQSVGATPFQPASQYQSPYSSVPYSTSIYGGQSYGWSNPSIVPQFPS